LEFDVGASHGKIGDIHKWWTAKSRENFNAKVKCIIDQYDALEVGVCRWNCYRFPNWVFT